ncbi:hypothetical protein DZK27_11705 [Rhodobacteraceae bacterium 63075]|nr:hypothetical protein DZK27_11705 [Rhodobacteraceae bacterium 63075]
MTKFTAKPVKGAAESQARMPRSIKGVLRDFADDESGVLVAFSIWFMLMILFVGALGVDVMRYETQRTRLQASLDQAVLAAADLDQKRDSATVVADYFDKFKVDAQIVSLDVDEGLAHREVVARAEKTVPTQLVHMLGVDEFNAPALSRAVERVENVEISLVLDISGSMSGNKISRLQTAATEFVDTIFEQNQSEGVTLSIIPYSTQVNVGEHMLDELDVSDGHENSHCVNIEEPDFNNTRFELAGSGRVYEQTQHFDVFTYSEGELSAPVCRDDPGAVITPISGDRAALKTAINQLSAGGNTSIDLGIKWGAMLLDPSTQAAVSGLIDDGVVNPIYANRPLNYQGDDAIKVLVVMTDGQNTSQYRLDDPYRSGDSNVWYNAAEDRYGVYWPNSKRFYRQSYSGNYRINTSNGYYIWQSSDSAIANRISNEFPGYERLTFPELFAQASNAWIAYYLYSPVDYNYWSNWYHAPRDIVHPGSSKDGHTQTVCNSVKQQDIVVYTIGFEAPKHSENLLESCASTRSHFFDVDGIEISDAFAAIAASISQLKLIQ